MITFEDVRRVAVELDPTETNHGACVYTREDGGHCVVGEIMVRLGLPVPASHTRLNDKGLDNILFDTSSFSLQAKMSHQALNALTIAQRAADLNQNYWGYALRLAGLID